MQPDKSAESNSRPRTRPVLLMRHALTDWNERGLVIGQTDIPLNVRGLRQVEEATDHLKSLGIDALFSSSMQRCHQTANIVASALGLSVIVVDSLAERNWGELEGRHRSERDPNEDPPGGETHEQFRDRVVRAFAAIDGSAQRPLIVTHSGVIKLAMMRDAKRVPKARIPHVIPIEVNI